MISRLHIALLALSLLFALLFNVAGGRTIRELVALNATDTVSTAPNDDVETLRRDVRPYVMRRMDSGWQPFYLDDDPIPAGLAVSSSESWSPPGGLLTDERISFSRYSDIYLKTRCSGIYSRGPPSVCFASSFRFRA